MISILELEDRFDFRIDNQPFSMLYLSEKTKKNFRHEGYSSKYDEPAYEPKPKVHAPPQPKKKDNFEFDTGFGQFDYRPSRDSLPKTQKPKPEPEFVSTPWETEIESERKAPPPPPPKREDFDWNGPSKFQFDDPSNSPAYAQQPPNPAPRPQPQMQPPPQSRPQAPPQMPPQQYTQAPPPPPVKEEPKPIIDFLSMDQPNDTSDDFFANGIGVVPFATQYKQPEIISFSQQPTTQPDPVAKQPSISSLDLGISQPTSYNPSPFYQPAAAPSQSTVPLMQPVAGEYGGQHTQPSTNVTTSPPMQYAPPPMASPAAMQPAETPSVPFTQPMMNPEEKKSSSTDLGSYFDNAPAPSPAKAEPKEATPTSASPEKPPEAKKKPYISKPGMMAAMGMGLDGIGTGMAAPVNPYAMYMTGMNPMMARPYNMYMTNMMGGGMAGGMGGMGGMATVSGMNPAMSGGMGGMGTMGGGMGAGMGGMPQTRPNAQGQNPFGF
eukprot:TRINITY_DN3384_c0_g1_i8.p1 TRINITY_DN3384_c0_g1~~TRINITY_DN3384_c0_g1_i8.p1  ORF type:complete len:492 (+),score=102.93 TRINITY_DN3384_c0_g1_i8:2-1477(+)